MSKGSEIKQIIKNIATNNVGINLFEGEVTEAKDTTISAKIQGLTHENIRLVSGFANSTATMIVKPQKGSKVLIADLSAGKMRDLIVLMVEKAEAITFNGGANGGLINIAKLKDNLDSLKKYCEALKNAVSNGLSAVGAGELANGETGATTFDQAMSTESITISDMEDKNIKH